LPLTKTPICTMRLKFHTHFRDFNIETVQ